jgi:hypothetical protein
MPLLEYVTEQGGYEVLVDDKEFIKKELRFFLRMWPVGNEVRDVPSDSKRNGV